MKKLVALVVVFCLVLSMSVPAGAAYLPTSDASIIRPDAVAEGNIKEGQMQGFVSNGHGEYTLIANPNESMFNTNSTGTQYIFADYTGKDAIFHVEGDKYLLQVEGNTYLLNQKVDIDESDFSKNEPLFDKYNVSDRMIQDIKDVMAEQQRLNNTDFSIDLYIPTGDDGPDSTVVSPLGLTENKTDYFNHTYKGKTYRLRNHSLKYSNLSTSMVNVTGDDALKGAKAKASINLIVGVGGALTNSTSLAVIGAGMSIYDYYKAVVGPVTTGSSSDKLSVSVVYDRRLTETSVYNSSTGKWELGLTFHNAWVNYVYISQYYSSTGIWNSEPHKINKNFYSDNYNNYNFAIETAPVDYYDTPLFCEYCGVKVRMLGT